MLSHRNIISCELSLGKGLYCLLFEAARRTRLRNDSTLLPLSTSATDFQVSIPTEGPARGQGREHANSRHHHLPSTSVCLAVLQGTGWGEIFATAEDAATKVKVVQYNRPIPSSRCLRGATQHPEPRSTSPPPRTPVPPPAKGKFSHQGG